MKSKISDSFITVITALLLILISSSCNDSDVALSESTGIKSGNLNDIALRHPACIPNYLTLPEINPNLDWLAVALCKFGGDQNTTADPMLFRRDIEKLLNQDNEVYMPEVITHVSSNHFRTPRPNSSMVQAMLAEMTNSSNQPPTQLLAWDKCLYEVFKWGNEIEPYLIYIDVRDFDILSSAQKNLPLLVIAAYEGRVINNANPVYGYYFDPVTSSVEQQVFASEEEINDFYDLNTHYIWRLDVEDTETPLITWQYCEEGMGVRCGDTICDIGCGESEVNCPEDCNPTDSRTVRIEKVKILSDVKVKYAGGMKYREKLGKYEVAYSATVVHGAGNTGRHEIRAICKVRPKIKRRHVERKKYIPPSRIPAKIKGSNKEYDDIYVKGNKGDGLPIVSEGFNPMFDRIYIYFYEHDWEANKKREEIWANADPNFSAPGSKFLVSDEKFGKCSGLFPHGLIQPNQLSHGSNNGPDDGPSYPVGHSLDVVEVKPSDWQFNPSEGPNGTGRFVFEGVLDHVVNQTSTKGHNTFSFTLIYQ